MSVGCVTPCRSFRGMNSSRALCLRVCVLGMLALVRLVLFLLCSVIFLVVRTNVFAL